jgi:hypothetical protein
MGYLQKKTDAVRGLNQQQRTSVCINSNDLCPADWSSTCVSDWADTMSSSGQLTFPTQCVRPVARIFIGSLICTHPYYDISTNFP